MEPKIIWLGHSSFRIEGNQTIYIDPWQLKGDHPTADIIMITHVHHDHCSPDDVAKISGPNTIIVTEKDSQAQLSGDIRVMAPGDHITVKDIEIDAVPAYNIDKQFHPKANGWIGFVFTMDGTRFYHTGDTDCIPEMETIETDVAFIPVSGTYVMDVDDALKAIELIEPTLAIPMHWGTIVGSVENAVSFKQKASCKVEVLPDQNQ
jgi:L-ascorbate metabolism protein UlaG (beta-lactamase superfamily)